LSVAVEHDKRKKEILEKSLDVFIEEGYEDTTFQKIAERCGITRTILYLYFKNKREIFTFSIKQFTERLEGEFRQVIADDARNCREKLGLIAEVAISQCFTHRRLLSVIVDYLDHLRKSGGDPDERVRRRTIRMRHLLSGLVIAGQKAGEFHVRSVKAIGDAFMAFIEAAVFRIVVLGRTESPALIEAARVFIAGLAKAE
jgi:AcrR family transcriptional regulator